MPFTLAFRPIEGADFNFILNAWMMSYRDSKRDHKNSDYFPGQQNLIAEISQRRNLIVGCDAETPEWIAGFICGIMLEDGRLLLDYIYVKQAYRERGIARGLLSAMGWDENTEIVATHWTKQIDKVGRRYNAGHNSYFNQIGFSNV
jgi:GNAT superfamily N-acetyltransferase